MKHPFLTIVLGNHQVKSGMIICNSTFVHPFISLNVSGTQVSFPSNLPNGPGLDAIQDKELPLCKSDSSWCQFEDGWAGPYNSGYFVLFCFSFPFLPSLFLGWKEEKLESCLWFYLERAIALNWARLGIMKEKKNSVFQGDLDIISLHLQRNVWVERKRDSLLNWAGALQGPIIEFNLFVLILYLCSAGELLKENTLYIQTKYQ